MNLQTISLVAGTVVAVAGALAVFGVKDVPRWAWHSEHVQLAGDLTELDSRVTSQQLDDAKLQLYQNQREQRKYPAGDYPPILLDEQIDLERRIDDLQEHLDDLREQDKG